MVNFDESFNQGIEEIRQNFKDYLFAISTNLDENNFSSSLRYNQSAFSLFIDSSKNRASYASDFFFGGGRMRTSLTLSKTLFLVAIPRKSRKAVKERKMNPNIFLSHIWPNRKMVWIPSSSHNLMRIKYLNGKFLYWPHMRRPCQFKKNNLRKLG